MSVVLLTLQRSVFQAFGTDSLCEIHEDSPTAVCLTLQSVVVLSCLGPLSHSPQFPLNSQKMMPLIARALPSESRLIAVLYLCAPHSAHGACKDHGLQHDSCRGLCRVWSGHKRAASCFLHIHSSWINAGTNEYYYSQLSFEKIGLTCFFSETAYYLYLTWNSTLQPLFCRRLKASNKYLGSSQAALF